MKLFVFYIYIYILGKKNVSIKNVSIKNITPLSCHTGMPLLHSVTGFVTTNDLTS